MAWCAFVLEFVDISGKSYPQIYANGDEWLISFYLCPGVRQINQYLWSSDAQAVAPELYHPPIAVSKKLVSP
jgi:hypothetical protein